MSAIPSHLLGSRSRALLTGSIATFAATVALSACSAGAEENDEPVTAAASALDASNCACFTNTNNVCNYTSADRVACGLPSGGCATNDDWNDGWAAYNSACEVPRSCPCITTTDNACNYASALDRGACGVPSGGCAANDDWNNGWYAHDRACSAPTFDALDYMRNTHGGTLLGDDGSIVSFVEQPGGHFYYVKGASSSSNDGSKFERFGFDGNTVWLERDTTWPASDRGPFDSYDAVSPTTHQYGVHTRARRSMRDGESWSTSVQIIGFQTGSDPQRCRWSNRAIDDRNNTTGFDYTVKLVKNKSWGGDVGTVDSIGVKTGDEVHWYAKGWGWVSFEWNGPPTEGLKTVVWNRWIGSQKQPRELCPSGPLPFEQRYPSTRVGLFHDGQWVLDTGAVGYQSTDRNAWWGAAGDIPVAGRWDGSGTTRLGVARVLPEGAMSWYLDYNGSGAIDSGDRVYQFGQRGDTPVVGDWTGTGQARIGIFLNGMWVLDINGNGLHDGGDRVTWWGAPGDIPVVGSWDGSGVARLGVARVLSNGMMWWYLDYNGNGTVDSADRTLQLGLRGDIPVVGDWTGTGQSRIGVFRDGQWYMDVNANGWDTQDATPMVYGSSYWRPVTGAW